MVIDCNALFGFEQQYNKDLSIEKLLEIMDNMKIDKALITNMQCKYYDFIEGNNETADIIKKNPERFIWAKQYLLLRKLKTYTLKFQL